MFFVALAFAGEPAVAPEPAAATEPTAVEILHKIDDNLTYDTRTMHVKMTVEGGRTPRTYEMQTWGRGKEDTAVNYLAPARDKGTRMLRKADELWLYLPAVERTQKLSGHMLRQGMMGSDMSYEDLMSSSDLAEDYDAKVVGTEPIDGRPCYKLELTARDPSITYPKRVSYVDQELWIPLQQELYAVSGMLLKRWSMSEIQAFEGGRHFPARMVIEDVAKGGSKTVLELTEVTFGVTLEEDVFSMRWLERG